jgi:hypothetical protein
MRNQNVRGEAAIGGDTEITIVSAQILLAAAAGGAGPTTNPGINGNTAADDRRIGVAADVLSARMNPEDLREVISAYQKCVAETVRRFGGFVAKYMGDGVLVYFGYPADA